MAFTALVALAALKSSQSDQSKICYFADVSVHAAGSFVEGVADTAKEVDMTIQGSYL